MEDIRDRIDSFVNDYLPHTEFLNDKPKFIHDPLWGTIELYEHELSILDTPLLQRLRQIHQTGFVYETFPSAQHTRFEHTIGVIHIASRIAQTLKKKYNRIIDWDIEKKVRLAALMHDVGHSAFSHTSEEIFENCEDITQLINAGGEFAGKGAGEVLSYLITTSKPFRKFYDQIIKHYSLEIKIDDFAPLILGRVSKDKMLFEAEIISGPIDADKLDYFPRDGRAVGIELSLDIDRLLHCIEIVDDPNGHSSKILVVNRGGYNPIQQLLFARAILFATVYHHHKVRSCDCMFKSCLSQFVEKEMPFKVTNMYPQGFTLNNASDFLYITDIDFLSNANQYNPDTFEHSASHDLLYRKLFKRVLSISTLTIIDYDDENKPEIKAGYGQFYNLRSNQEKLREFSDKIWEQAKIEIPKWFIWVDIPRKTSFDKAGLAMINRAAAGRKPDIVKLSKAIPTEDWGKTYQQYFEQSYIFGPPDVEIRKKIASVAKNIIKNDFGFELNDYAFPECLVDNP
ncbi:MAG: HD domain-containing protein [Spirochaetales bacterium]|nr:HD domain-containing protein [Spirochaetales bacterium]